MSKSDAILVSREVLDTMRDAVTYCRDQLLGPVPANPSEHGRQLGQLTTKMLDVQIALEALCPPQS